MSDQNKPARQARIPAHFESVPAVESLAPTLAPEQFTGKARQAYQVAKQIPQTLAQLPCYCYCDEEHGHKSLHSCYETEHSSMCAVCVNEALLAYRLEKQERLTPSQIRDRIIAEYSRTE
ncbi:MAG TPA: CYCXC family (seleno)protein [Pyrinomonadaceae bacterium]|nr:CYCXC family (seleno)protein [Pyrinomonadaceae bacterium]